MDKIVPIAKKVNAEKLSALTDAELTDRITKSPEKAAQKKAKFMAQHQLNLARQAAYEAYRKADAAVCVKILAERKSKSELPKGGSPSVGNAPAASAKTA